MSLVPYVVEQTSRGERSYDNLSYHFVNSILLKTPLQGYENRRATR